MFEDCEELARVISAGDLLNRWPAVSEAYLALQTKNGRLTAYTLYRSLQGPDGKVIHMCLPGARPYENGYGADASFDWGNIVYDLGAIEYYEKMNPKCLWREPPKPLDPSAFLTAEDLCLRWAISPAKLIQFIRSENGLPAYWEEEDPYADVPF